MGDVKPKADSDARYNAKADRKVLADILRLRAGCNFQSEKEDGEQDAEKDEVEDEDPTERLPRKNLVLIGPLRFQNFPGAGGVQVLQTFPL